MKTLLMTLSVLSLYFLAGCASMGGDKEPAYGAQKRNVTLQTAPASGYEVFVVDNAEWMKHQADLIRGQGLDAYRKGVSPVKLKLYPVKQVFIARDPSGKFMYQSFVPSEDNWTETITFMSSTTKGS
ncbi:MAG TPA: hypothetical protein VEV81_11715 [Pyrinomonadaceae bacterium]|nr:hypothetical protein [Pyrinomonadaceae bacterium]